MVVPTTSQTTTTTTFVFDFAVMFEWSAYWSDVATIQELKVANSESFLTYSNGFCDFYKFSDEFCKVVVIKGWKIAKDKGIDLIPIVYAK